MMSNQTILWRRLDRPGHESARLFFQNSHWHLHGTAVFVHEQQPCRLDYAIACNAEWQTSSATVRGWAGNLIIDIEISVDSAQRWQVNGVECPAVTGCLDLDLNFSPSTNLLPIRRLHLAVGQEAQVKAAWLRFPSFALEPLEQRYRRREAASYRYESAGGSFVAELAVNAAGFVTHYPNFCQTEV